WGRARARRGGRAGAAGRRGAAAAPPAGVPGGGAVWPAGRGRPADLLRAADAAQYAAKRSGRGRVCVAGEPYEGSGAPWPGRGRALRDAAGDRDPVALLGEILTLLDTTLGDAEPADRLTGIVRRIADRLGVPSWSVAWLAPGEPARAVSAAGCMGDLGDLQHRGPWLTRDDLLDLELTREGFAESGATVVGVGDRGLPESLSARMRDTGFEAMLVVVADDSRGAWLVELGADNHSASLDRFPPVLRVLVGEALRPHLLAIGREPGG
ncbi:MAG: hypothetical protein LT070_00560, partial [Solirubrobacteraceae bacterium]|nr:hypothetical protein [Solirubrobacteraceae bacterium]